MSVAKPLDFERTKTYYVNVRASDKAAADTRQTSVTLLTVHVTDSDDQGPVFSDQVYTTRVVSGQVSGVLDIKPDTLHAVDQDSLRY